MHLTQTLYKYHHLFIGKIPKFKGSALSGKHRFVPAATRGTRYRLWSQWKIEEANLKYLEKPYITSDEEITYLRSVGLKHQDVDPLYTSKIETPMRQHYGADVLTELDRARQFEITE